MLLVLASIVVVALGGSWLGRWLDPTRRLHLGGLSRQPPFALPDFTLVDDGGRPIGKRDLDGHVVVADFVFLQCGDTCALVNRRVAELARRVADPEVRFVTFSVDAGDGPATLARYRRAWDRRHDPRWRFVAADAVRFPAFAVDVGLATDTADVPGAFAYNGRYLFLIDRAGVVRRGYDGLDDDEARALGDDLQALAQRSAAREDAVHE